ncbi:MAG: phage integrase N-terminal SAM-like domain-containing protein, partial [Candidatus Absconditabacterales bacterium]
MKFHKIYQNQHDDKQQIDNKAEQINKSNQNKSIKSKTFHKHNNFFKNNFSGNKLSNLLEKYIFYLKYEKNVSPKTLENYSLWLNRLIEFVGDINISELNRMQILDYRMALYSNGLAQRTINYHIVAIRAFLKFLLKNDIDCLSPDKLELAKVPSREVNYLNDEDINK